MVYLHTGEDLVATPQCEQPDLLLLLVMEKAGSRPQYNVETSETEPTWAVLHRVLKACRSELQGLKCMYVEKVPLTLAGSVNPGPSS